MYIHIWFTALKFMETHMRNIWASIEIYGNTYEKYLSKLMILNSRIYYAPIDTRRSQLYTNLSTMPLPDLHKFQILKYIHKVIHQQDQLRSIYSYYF